MRAVVAGACSGALLVFCFPRTGMAFLAWIALVPYLYQLTRSRLRQGMLAGAAMGVVFHIGNLYWVSDVMVNFGGGIGRMTSIAVLLALVGYLSLYSIAFGGLAAAASARGGVAALFVMPALWVGIDFFRVYPFGGFPWCLIGYSQAPYLPVIQLASLTSIHGVSLLLVLVNALLAYALTRPGLRRWSMAAAPVILAVGATLAFGYRELAREVPVPELRVAAVQGNVLQEQKWKPGYAADIFARHIRLSHEAADRGARLIVWPESSTPFHFDGTPSAAGAMRSFARERNVYLLFGSDDYERVGSNGEGYRAFNGAKLLGPDGDLLLRYRKIFLVPFGEFNPLPTVSGLTESLVQQVSDFSPGEEVEVAEMEGARVGAFICYEAIYPDLVRRFVTTGAGLLVNVTNDAWFGRTSAPYQHLAQAAVRAVETRRYLVRAANTGISAVIDPFGRILTKSELFIPEVIHGKVSLRQDETFYVRHGNFLARTMAVVTCLFAAVVIGLDVYQRYRRRHPRDRRRKS